MRASTHTARGFCLAGTEVAFDLPGFVAEAEALDVLVRRAESAAPLERLVGGGERLATQIEAAASGRRKPQQ